MENVTLRSGLAWRSSASLALALAVGVLGVVMAHHPMLASGFRRMQTDLGDSRFIHYLLEHGYRWMRGEPGHRELWNPPIFYPLTSTPLIVQTISLGNPFYIISEDYRRALVYHHAPDVVGLLYVGTLSLVLALVGLRLFRRWKVYFEARL